MQKVSDLEYTKLQIFSQFFIIIIIRKIFSFSHEW